MVWFKIVLLMVALDFFCMHLYCSFRKKKSNYTKEKILSYEKYHEKNENLPSIESSGGAVNNNISSRFTNAIRNGIDSVLRVNLFVVSYFPSHHVRNFLYRQIFRVHIEKKAIIYYGAEIRAPWNLYIGKGSIIGDHALLDARSGLYIGKNVNFSNAVWVYTLQHNIDARDFGTKGEHKSVVINDRAWLSTRTIVLPGVTIGEGSVVAAGAVVTKSTEPYFVYGGIPGEKIGIRNRNIDYEFNGNHLHFF